MIFVEWAEFSPILFTLVLCNAKWVVSFSATGEDVQMGRRFTSRSDLFDHLVTFFPDHMTQPKTNLIDFITLHWFIGIELICAVGAAHQSLIYSRVSMFTKVLLLFLVPVQLCNTTNLQMSSRRWVWISSWWFDILNDQQIWSMHSLVQVITLQWGRFMLSTVLGLNFSNLLAFCSLDLQ